MNNLNSQKEPINRCRTCLAEIANENFSYDINNIFIGSQSITSLLNFIKLDSESVTLPEQSKKICDTCFEEVNSFQAFIKKFLEVENLLKCGLNLLEAKGNSTDDIIKIVVTENEDNNTNNNNNSDKDYNDLLSLLSNNDCNRILSVKQTDKDIQEVFTELSSEKVQLFSFANQNESESNKPKRLLLLGDVSYKCSDCEMDFTKKSFLKEHIEKTHQKRYIDRIPDSSEYIDVIYDSNKVITKGTPCPVCCKIFINKNILEIHIQEQHKENQKPHKCVKCGMGFKTSITLRNHQRKFKEVCLRRQCKENVRPVKSREDSESNKDIYKCLECDLKFKNKVLLSKHEKVHVTKQDSAKGKKEELTTHLCFICGKIFSKPNLLSCHIRKVHLMKQDASIYYCDQCPKSFKGYNNLYHHYRRHLNQPLKCDECGITISGKISMKNHKKLKHPTDSENSLECSICGEKFVRADYYRRHLRMHANGTYIQRTLRKYIPVSTPVSCSICLKTLTNIECLKMHLKTHLRLKKRFKCNFCSITFSKACNKSKHEKKHKDASFKHRCTVCYKQHKSQEELEQHLKKHKTFNYECELCGKKFSRLYLLDNHFADHKDEVDMEKEERLIFEEALKPYMSGHQK